MRRFSILASFILIFTLFACGTFKTGKDIAIDSPIKESRKKQSLSKARQEVEKSRRELDNCLANYSCQREKENYNSDVEKYVSLQTN